MKQTLIIGLGLLIIAAGCSKQSTAPATELTAAEHLAQGWTYFNAGSYSSAQASFTSAIAKNAALADAYNGKGWCQGILGSPAGALATFKSGLSYSGTNNEIKAGMAFSYSVMDSSAQAVSNGLAVLAADSLWQFSHTYRESPRDNLLNYREVCLLLAQNYFKLGQFATALFWVQKLNPGYSADTATPSGQAALQGEIERLAGTM
jgi:tetratricopeptide (TPR) repeat protein